MWLSVLESDDPDFGKKAMQTYQGLGPNQLWDSGRVFSKWFYEEGLGGVPAMKKSPTFRHGFIWDAYFYYGPQDTWDAAIPKPNSFGAPVVRQKGPLLRIVGS